MADFAEAYIDLCRKLPLPREWREGDWFTWRFDTGRVNLLPQGWKSNDYRQLFDPPYPSTPRTPGGPVGIWLPQEGDLLDLLVAEGWMPTLLYDPTNDVWRCLADRWIGTEKNTEFAVKRDRKTALLRLYAAVKGIDLG